MLAAIGEQFTDFLGEDDDVCGLSVSPREKDDLIQVWNVNCKAVDESRVLEKIHLLMPDVRFNAEFYKREYTMAPTFMVYAKHVIHHFSPSDSFGVWQKRLIIVAHNQAAYIQKQKTTTSVCHKAANACVINSFIQKRKAEPVNNSPFH